MKNPNVDLILSALQQVLPKRNEPLGLHEPAFQGNEWLYVKECLDTGWVSSVGKYVDRFEAQLAEYTGVKKAIATVNGTAALHICLKLAGVENQDEVLVPTLTFVATCNALSYCGAIPNFVDSDEQTLGVDPSKLRRYLEEKTELRGGACFNVETGRRIQAMVPMHAFGHPVDLDSLMKVCQDFHIELIEDAAESLGSYYKGKHTGSFGKISALSFNGNKIVTTGGGGAILTQDESLGKLAKHLTTTAKVPHRWDFHHDQVGYNYRLPNINAALGCAQLEQMDRFLTTKRALTEKYAQVFKSVPGVRLFTESNFAKSNYWLNVLLLDEPSFETRDQILEMTQARGWLTRPAWKLMHRLPMFEKCPKMDLSQAEGLEKRLINLPSSAFLGASYV